MDISTFLLFLSLYAVASVRSGDNLKQLFKITIPGNDLEQDRTGNLFTVPEQQEFQPTNLGNEQRLFLSPDTRQPSSKLFLGAVSVSPQARKPPLDDVPSALTCENHTNPIRLAERGQQRIINGRSTSISTYPYQVAILLDNRLLCGGTLAVKKDVVLTACHCLMEGTSRLSVVAGTSDLSNMASPAQRLKVQKGICHQHYNRITAENDIALLKVYGGFNIGDRYKELVTLPKPFNALRGGTRCWISGWGTTKKHYRLIPNVLQHVEVPLVSFQYCSDRKRYGNDVKQFSMLCAGYINDGRADGCQGDSGGPLVCDADNDGVWELQGITSWGRGCAETNSPGVYVRVSSYVNWILKMAPQLN